MIKVICERHGCTAMAVTDDIYRNPPDGWVTVRVRGETRDRDFCSLECAATALVALDAERTRPQLKAVQ
jgi:hypothetical protein